MYELILFIVSMQLSRSGFSQQQLEDQSIDMRNK